MISCFARIVNRHVKPAISANFSSQAATGSQRLKHRVPVKRASKLLNELKVEEFQKLKNGRKWPQIKPGDAIEIDKWPFVSSPTTNIVKGVVIGISKKASDTNIKLLNVSFSKISVFKMPLLTTLFFM